jgi:hypothetical protein
MSRVDSLVDKVVAMPAVTPETAGAAVGVRLIKQDENPYAEWFQGEGRNRLARAGLRLDKNGPGWCLWVDFKLDPPIFEKDMDLGRYGEVKDIAPNPNIPPEGAATYTYDYRGYGISFTFTSSTKRLLGVTIQGSGKRGAPEPSGFIGMGTMDSSGTIFLDLRAEHEDGTTGMARLVYPPSHVQYKSILGHLGGLAPGQSKPVLPFDDKERSMSLVDSFELLARDRLKEGRRLLASHDFAAAARILREGVEALGDRYVDEKSLDSTGTKLVLAEHDLAAGKAGEAASLLERVLESRLAQYEKKLSTANPARGEGVDSVRDPAKAALSAAAGLLGAPSELLFSDDITLSKFPWCHRHKFFLVLNSEKRKVLVSVDPSGRAYAFSPIFNAFNMDEMNRIFQAEGIRLPDGLDLAWTLRNTLAGPGGWVASKEFFQDETAALAQWTAPCPADGPKRFEQSCLDPKLKKKGKEWVLEFRYFNPLGGVEECRAEGDGKSVLSFNSTEVLPNGTFQVPYN